jgi:glycosyltransferase involved in cell wall biosynthesis
VQICLRNRLSLALMCSLVKRLGAVVQSDEDRKDEIRYAGLSPKAGRHWPRVLHCCPRLLGGGAERQLSYLAEYAASLGQDIHIAYLSGSEVPPELVRKNIALHPIEHFSSYDPLILARLVRLIRSIKPDIMHTWLLQMDVWAGFAAYLTGTPWVLREPSGPESRPAGIKTIARIWIGRAADAVVSNSHRGDAYWAQYKNASGRFVVPNALPLEKIAATPASATNTLQQPGKRPLILYGGRLSKEKNLFTLVKALAIVTSIEGGTAVFLGDGPLRPALAQLIATLGADDRIILAGAIPQIWGILKCADLFVSISRFEGRPNAVLEAMGCGCPLVVSDIPAHREFLDEATALLVTQYENADSVVEAIRLVLHDREGALRRSTAAAQRTRDWNVPAIAEKYDAVYSTILERGPLRRPR